MKFYAPLSPRRKSKPSPSRCLPWRHESELKCGKGSLDGRLHKLVQRRDCLVGSTALRFHYCHSTLRSIRPKQVMELDGRSVVITTMIAQGRCERKSRCVL